MSNKVNHRHLTLSDRIYIEQGLDRQITFSDIARFIGKDPTTVSKEVQRHRIEKAYDRSTALCIHRATCVKTHMCGNRYCGDRVCGSCTQRSCHSRCSNYEALICRRIKRAPYVCNGCGIRSCRQNSKYYYRAQYAEQHYKEVLSASRSGINKTPLEIDDMDRIVSPLLKQGQPLGHIFATHGDQIGCSRRTLYNYIDIGTFSASNIDLPRKVRYKPRKKHITSEKPVPSYRMERTYKDFERYMEQNPDTDVVEMDTVEGKKGDPMLLTMLFRSSNFMMIFLLKHGTQDCVCNVFNALEQHLGTETMFRTFPVILTDNGTEFKNPALLETNMSRQVRTKLFYCDPMASWQKGRLEKNHEFIRYIVAKGYSTKSLSNNDVLLMMNHINSIARTSLNEHSPFDLASLLLPPELLKFLGAERIEPDAVVLNPKLLKMPLKGRDIL